MGVLGSAMTLFYVSVTTADKQGQGGGLASEGELIDIHLLPLTEVEAFISNDDILKPTSLMFALLWFLRYRSGENGEC